jgi:hypothetical protein
MKGRKQRKNNEITILSDKLTYLLLFQYTIAMMGYGPEDKSAVLELTYNYGVKEYEKGNGYGQVRVYTCILVS